MSLEQVSELNSEEVSLVRELGAEKAFEAYVDELVKSDVEYYMRMNINAILEKRVLDMQRYNNILNDKSKLRAMIKVKELDRLFLYKKLEKKLKEQ